MTGQKCGISRLFWVVSYDRCQVQFGDETLKYLPTWASAKPRGYVAPWPINLFMVVFAEVMPLQMVNTGSVLRCRLHP